MKIEIFREKKLLVLIPTVVFVWSYSKKSVFLSFLNINLHFYMG